MRWRDSYWGKARPAYESGSTWHPLAWHALDVAASMQALLSSRPAWTRNLARLTGLPEAEVQKRLILVAALHDLGKFADNFQSKVPDLYLTLNGGGQVFSDRRGHGDIGAELWEAWSSDIKPTIGAWVRAAFSHHGVPVPAPSQATADALSARSLADSLAFVEQVIDLVGCPEGPSTKQGVWLVSGLVILADWLGSNQAWFPYRKPDISLEAYWKLTQAQAQKAVSDANLAEAEIATGFDLSALLGDKAQPTPLQQWAECQRPGGSGHLYIIEDLTGSGKTEAALLLAHRLMASGAAEGLYWALPTMATANGLYNRLQGRYRSLFEAKRDPAQPPSLILSHSAADIHSAFQASVTHGVEREGQGLFQNAQEIMAEAYCAEFFAQDHKKALLAQVGVGTLDQALLSVLPVRHQSLKLAALARRVLVIDEAHSFDAYTGRLMERLLRFHALHGGSAIVLSATLSQALRQRLVQAYAKPAEVSSGAFPLITHVGPDGVDEQAIVSGRGTRRDLPIKVFDAVEPVLQALLDRAALGLCGVYIRNTVEDARAAYEVLKAAAPPGVSVHLFHARFTIGDRARIEAEALTHFGLASDPQLRLGRILVATQVVESSLDLDFDVMATDLCPMDLLIQRAGRLHRHAHRPPRPDPELWLLAPRDVSQSEEIWPSPDWYGALFPKGQYVYPDVGQLWRTLAVLKREGGLHLQAHSPRAYIEPVFGSDTVDTPDVLIAASDTALATRIAERGQANLNSLDYKSFGPWDQNVRTPTRLGEETRTIRLARWRDGCLSPWADEADMERAWRLSEISVDARRIASTLAPSDEAQAMVERVQISWAGRYDPPQILVLEPDEGGGVWRGACTDLKGRRWQVLYDPLLGFR